MYRILKICKLPFMGIQKTKFMPVVKSSVVDDLVRILILIFETSWIRILPGQLVNWQNLSVHVGLMQDL
jgi:hypothetical protein